MSQKVQSKRTIVIDSPVAGEGAATTSGATIERVKKWKAQISNINEKTASLASLNRSRLPSFKGKFLLNLNFQKNVMKYWIICGILSSVVFILYTILAMKLQRQEMVKNDLDIQIRMYEVRKLFVLQNGKIVMSR